MRHLAERITNYVPLWDSAGETYGNMKVMGEIFFKFFEIGLTHYLSIGPLLLLRGLDAH